jgi:hypothetical protein
MNAELQEEENRILVHKKCLFVEYRTEQSITMGANAVPKYDRVGITSKWIHFAVCRCQTQVAQ